MSFHNLDVEKFDDAVFVGQSQTNQFIINDPLVENVHLIITKKSNQHHVQMHDGVEGTFSINNSEVSESFIKTGDRIKVGNSFLTVNTEPELFLDIHTIRYARKSHRRLAVGLFAVALLTMVGFLTWPYFFPESSISRNFNQGIELYKVGEYEKARVLFLNIIEADNKHSDGYYNLALVMIKLGKPKNAINYVSQAIANNPQHIDSLLLATQFSIKLRNYKEALRTINYVMSINPVFINAGLVKSKIYDLIGDHNRAIFEAKSVLEINKQNTTASLTLSSLYIKYGQQKQAIETLTYSIKMALSNIRPLLLLASIYEKSNDTANGILLYSKGLSVDKTNQIAANNLAMLLIRNNDNSSLKRALTITKQFTNSDNPAFLDTLGYVLYKSGKYAESLTILKKSISISPNNPEINRHIGLLYKALGENELSEVHMEKASAGI
ncbi:MAG: tetratricopeptide repeat protein [Magnetococcales bacterium]|nr:tetratricopeptide repeat protein [Magnetococcales bacterium]